MQDYIFDVYNGNKKLAHVELLNNKKTVKIERFTNEFPQPFMGDKLDLERVYRFIKGRCFDENRPDKKELLRDLKIEEYNPWEIVKATHGRLLEDFYWIKFPGETITWKDLDYIGQYKEYEEEDYEQ